MDDKTVIELLRAARDSAKLDLAEFGHIFPEGKDLPYPTNEKEVTEFIRNRIDLHHRTWIIGPIERALRKLGDTGGVRG